MSQTVLITGVRGFVGHHMANHVLAQGDHVVGLTRQDVKAVPPQPGTTLLQTDWSPTSLCDIVHAVKPRYVVHCAGESDVEAAWADPLRVWEANVNRTVRLLDALRAMSGKRRPRVLLIGTLHEYHLAEVPQTGLTETSRIAPNSPYGWSKTLQATAAAMYAMLFSMPIILTRVFNLVGPDAERGICAKLVRRAARIQQGTRAPRFAVGSTAVARDFLDVRDAVAAFWALLQTRSVQPGTVFNVCRGQPVPLGDIIAMLERLIGRTCFVTENAELLRSTESERIFGNPAKLCATTGWQPAIDLQTTLSDALALAMVATPQRREERS